MEWRDIPPGRAIPQALGDPALALSRSRDGPAVWAGCAVGQAPNCNTSPQSAVDE
jgi:hypothetical protein